MLGPARNLLSSRATTQICSRCLSTSSRRALPQCTITAIPRRSNTPKTIPLTSQSITRRAFATSSRRLASAPTATEAMGRIEQLYENATEEFQIAAEETQGNTVYAPDDRAAAKAEVERLEGFYKEVVEGTGYEQSVREEVRRRAGGRVRELVNAMTALEERAMAHD